MKTIYKFEHNDNTYIGSSTNFKARCWAHNQHKKQTRYHGIKLYKYCNENNITDIRDHIDILEEIDDDDIGVLGLKIIEQEYINIFKPKLNMMNALSKKKISLYINGGLNNIAN